MPSLVNAVHWEPTFCIPTIQSVSKSDPCRGHSRPVNKLGGTGSNDHDICLKHTNLWELFEAATQTSHS